MIRVIVTLNEETHTDGTMSMAIGCQTETDIAGSNKTTHNEMVLSQAVVDAMKNFAFLMEKTAKQVQMPWYKRLFHGIFG